MHNKEVPFTHFFTTTSGLSTVSPVEALQKGAGSYHDQVLETLPFAANDAIKSIAKNIGGLIPKGPILEIGCGTGVLTQKLRQRGLSVYGIDIKDYGSFWKRKGIDRYCFVGNIEDMSGVRDHSFALLITRAFWDSVFGTIPGAKALNNPHDCFREITRVLKTKGVFLPLAERRHENELTRWATQFGFRKLPQETDFPIGFIQTR